MGDHAESRTEHITENGEDWDYCGGCFETAYLMFHLAPWEELSCRLAKFREGRYLESELVGFWPPHP